MPIVKPRDDCISAEKTVERFSKFAPILHVINKVLACTPWHKWSILFALEIN